MRKLLEGGFKLPPSGEICILWDFKYRQKIRKDRSDGENTPEIRGEKLEIRIKDEFIKAWSGAEAGRCCGGRR